MLVELWKFSIFSLKDVTSTSILIHKYGEFLRLSSCHSKATITWIPGQRIIIGNYVNDKLLSLQFSPFFWTQLQWLTHLIWIFTDRFKWILYVISCRKLHVLVLGCAGLISMYKKKTEYFLSWNHMALYSLFDYVPPYASVTRSYCCKGKQVLELRNCVFLTI